MSILFYPNTTADKDFQEDFVFLVKSAFEDYPYVVSEDKTMRINGPNKLGALIFGVVGFNFDFFKSIGDVYFNITQLENNLGVRISKENEKCDIYLLNASKVLCEDPVSGFALEVISYGGDFNLSFKYNLRWLFNQKYIATYLPRNGFNNPFFKSVISNPESLNGFSGVGIKNSDYFWSFIVNSLGLEFYYENLNKFSKLNYGLFFGGGRTLHVFGTHNFLSIDGNSFNLSNLDRALRGVKNLDNSVYRPRIF